MIGMAKACKGGTALANYVMKDDKGYELCRNGLSGESPTEILQEMKIIQEQNQRAVNRTFSLVLSPEKEEGKSLDNEKLRQLTKEFMIKLKIDPNQQQFVAFVHTEKEHKHVHIIANRVQEGGELISDHHIGKRAQWAAHHVAKEHGLISAKEVFLEKFKDEKLDKDIDQFLKQEMYKKHLFVMKSQPSSMEKYMLKMEELGVKVTPTINIQGQAQGHRMMDLATGKDFKASDVHRQLSLKKIMEKGLPFHQPDLLLNKSLELAQNKALKLVKETIKELVLKPKY